MSLVTDPRQEGLPAINRASRAPDGQQYLLFRGIEALTHDLREGVGISPEAVAVAEDLIRRVDAMKDALEMRFQQQVTIVDEGDA